MTTIGSGSSVGRRRFLLGAATAVAALGVLPRSSPAQAEPATGKAGAVADGEEWMLRSAATHLGTDMVSRLVPGT